MSRAGGALGASLVTTDGDYSPLSVSSEGHLRVEEGCRIVRSSIAIAGSSWAKGDSEAAMSVDGHRADHEQLRRPDHAEPAANHPAQLNQYNPSIQHHLY